MTCREMDNILISLASGSPLPPDALKHIAACERCQSLVNVFDASPQGAQLLPGQLSGIKTAVLGNLKPVRPLAPAGVFLLGIALIFSAVVAAAYLVLTMKGWPALDAGQKLSIFTALGASAVFLALSLVRQMAPGSKQIVSPALLPVGILALLLSVFSVVFQSHREADFVSNGLICLKTGLAFAAPGAMLFWLLLRRGAILSPTLMGASTGGLAGLVGLTVIEIQCPNLNGSHVIAWHWGVVVVSALVGTAIGLALERIFRDPMTQPSS